MDRGCVGGGTMNPEDVGRVLDEIGERIGPAGEYAWTLTVRQVYFEAVVWGALSLVMIVGFVIALVVIWRMYLTKVRRWDNPDERPAGYRASSWRPEADGYAFASLAPIFALVLGTLGLATSLMKLVNPEYHAMVRLLERIVP